MASFYSIYIHPRADVTQEQIEEKMNLAVDWYRYTNQNWIVYTTSDAKMWHSRLQPFFQPGGYVLIMKLDLSDYTGFMDKKLWEWLKKSR